MQAQRGRSQERARSPAEASSVRRAGGSFAVDARGHRSVQSQNMPAPTKRLGILGLKAPPPCQILPLLGRKGPSRARVLVQVVDDFLELRTVSVAGRAPPSRFQLIIAVRRIRDSIKNNTVRRIQVLSRDGVIAMMRGVPQVVRRGTRPAERTRCHTGAAAGCLFASEAASCRSGGAHRGPGPRRVRNHGGKEQTSHWCLKCSPRAAGRGPATS
jgi:hypothetical protein